MVEKIKSLIKEKKIKKSDLAKYLNITPQRLNNWFLRGNIPSEYIPKIANFLGVSTDYLLGNDLPSIVTNAPVINNINSHILNSHISINDAINSLPPEVGAIVKYMMELNEKERLEFMQCVFKNCSKEER